MQGANGVDFDVRATEPMATHARGQYTTWSGVGFDVWHHGRSGIGTSQSPATPSNVAVYAVGNISSEGRIIAAGIPIHVMTLAPGQNRLELHAGDPDFPLPGIPDGHLRVAWTDYTGGHSSSGVYARYALGSAVLLVMLGFALAAVKGVQKRRA